jgi:hypothetical protein
MTRHPLTSGSKLSTAILFTALTVPDLDDQTLAVPNAESYGRYASGGRGGDAFVVTNLNHSSAGTRREGVTHRNESTQWFRGDREIAGVTGSSHDLGAVDLAAAGPYDVMATHVDGTVTSESAVLTVAAVSEIGMFATSFGSDTIHSACPVLNPTRTNWYVISSKNATGSSVNGASVLDLTMAATSSHPTIHS